MSKAITIPKEMAKNDDLVVIPRKEYESFLRRFRKDKERNNYMWQKTGKRKLFESYDQADTVYDQV